MRPHALCLNSQLDIPTEIVLKSHHLKNHLFSGMNQFCYMADLQVKGLKWLRKSSIASVECVKLY